MYTKIFNAMLVLILALVVALTAGIEDQSRTATLLISQSHRQQNDISIEVRLDSEDTTFYRADCSVIPTLTPTLRVQLPDISAA